MLRQKKWIWVVPHGFQILSPSVTRLFCFCSSINNRPLVTVAICVHRAPGMANLLGLLKVKVIRGVKLVVRDSVASDPYLIVRHNNHKLKTRVVKKNVNPEWNEELTLSIVDAKEKIKIEVFDWDKFSFDDPMGVATIDIQPFVEAIKNLTAAAKAGGDLPPNNTIIRTILPCRDNDLADSSRIYFSNGKFLQDIVLRLRSVESGEVEIQLMWVDIP
ncbi:C2 domain-containing protein-like [Zostera marina]|uniref:C2 domain-containing protein-like n=1 Tax=Zostera marina TaxID=29655 RepID=A0A0K9PKW0_ZOSMR|nr:C2 domain-containing protein-like [Zostera marina]